MALQDGYGSKIRLWRTRGILRRGLVAGGTLIGLILFAPTVLGSGVIYTAPWGPPTISPSSFAVTCPPPATGGGFVGYAYSAQTSNQWTPPNYYTGGIQLWQEGDAANGTSCLPNGAYSDFGYVISQVQFQTATFSFSSQTSYSVSADWSWSAITWGVGCYTLGASNSHGYAFAVAAESVDVYDQTTGNLVSSAAGNEFTQSANYNTSAIPHACQPAGAPAWWSTSPPTWNVPEVGSLQVSIPNVAFAANDVYYVYTFVQIGTEGVLGTGDGNLYACIDGIGISTSCAGSHSGLGWNLQSIDLS